jgi:hypothetical protein
MKYPVLGLLAIAVVAIVALAPLSAHHEISAKFDPAKTMTLSGVITKVDWSDPHAHIFVNVTQGGNVANWAVELESLADLQRSGWTRDTVKVGETLRVQGMTARDGSRQIWGNQVTAGGKRVFEVRPLQGPSGAGGPTPRWPDGQPRLGPPPGQTGYWALPSQTILSEVAVQASPMGLLRNLADIDKVAPFQRWARDLFEYRQRNFLKDDPQYLQCLPPGGPRQYQLPYGVQFVEDRDHKRIFVYVGSVNRNWRLMYLDGRPQRGSLRSGDADNPLFYGRPVGKWDGDTLVIDTIGFNERFWFSNGGLPHTEKLHLIERYSRPDMNTLRYEVTIDDPGAYTRSWKSSWTLKWIAGQEMPINLCQDNRP